MAMIISDVYPDYVYSTIANGDIVDAVDFKKKVYVELSYKTVAEINSLLTRAKKDNDIKFFKIETTVDSK